MAVAIERSASRAERMGTDLSVFELAAWGHFAGREVIVHYGRHVVNLRAIFALPILSDPKSLVPTHFAYVRWDGDQSRSMPTSSMDDPSGNHWGTLHPIGPECVGTVEPRHDEPAMEYYRRVGYIFKDTVPNGDCAAEAMCVHGGRERSPEAKQQLRYELGDMMRQTATCKQWQEAFVVAGELNYFRCSCAEICCGASCHSPPRACASGTLDEGGICDACSAWSAKHRHRVALWRRSGRKWTRWTRRKRPMATGDIASEGSIVALPPGDCTPAPPVVATSAQPDAAVAVWAAGGLALDEEDSSWWASLPERSRHHLAEAMSVADARSMQLAARRSVPTPHEGHKRQYIQTRLQVRMQLATRWAAFAARPEVATWSTRKQTQHFCNEAGGLFRNAT